MEIQGFLKYVSYMPDNFLLDIYKNGTLNPSIMLWLTMRTSDITNIMVIFTQLPECALPSK